MNREWSDLENINLKETKTSLSLSNHAVGACFKPCNALCNWHTKCREFEFSKPAGCSIYTSSCKSPFKKALFTSNYLTYQPFDKAIIKKILIVIGFTTRLKVLVKSKLTSWRNPFATNCALCFSILLSGFSFTLNTHLQPIAFLLSGKCTSDQVLFLTSADYSSVIAAFEWSCCKASWMKTGSLEAIKT